jgi:hypothetical protein
MSREYIQLSIFEQNTVFLAIYKPKSVRNRPFFGCVFTFRVAWGCIDTFDSLHHHPPASSWHTNQY